MSRTAIGRSVRPRPARSPAEPGEALVGLVRRCAADAGRADVLTMEDVAWVERAVLARDGWGSSGDDVAVVAPASLPAGVEWLAGAHERALGAIGEGGTARRKRTGSYYTPADVVEGVLDVALEPLLEECLAGRGVEEAAGAILGLRIVDPACGPGPFLRAAARRLATRLHHATGLAMVEARARVIEHCIFGMDLCPLAAELCRFLLWHDAGSPRAWSADGGPLGRHIRAGDGLLAAWDGVCGEGAASGGFDLVVGNPPFLSQLASSTARSRVSAAQLEARFGAVARGYCDTAGLFLMLGVELARADGGRVALLQPQSVLASRDAEPIRAELSRRASVESVWMAGEAVFDAGVLVVAPVLRRGGRQGAIRRRVGREFRAIADASAGDGGGWSGHLADALDVPRVDVGREDVGGGRTLADIAFATADFRDQYYGLRGLVVEDAELTEDERAGFPPLITTGLIDAARGLWGERATRFDKRAWRAPRVDLGRLERTTTLGPWARARLTPKVLLATQTPVLECVVDERGAWLPAVPTITITPKAGVDPWSIAAILLCPAVSTIALRRVAGAGLSSSAIKLSAKQVLALPAPGAGHELGRAAELVRRAQHARDAAGRMSALVESGRVVMGALGITPGEREAAERWWLGRARLTGPVGRARIA